MSNWLKLALGWAVTVVVALAFSWGAIAQVRDRVDQPATVIPTSFIEQAAASLGGDPAVPMTTLEVVDIAPEVSAASGSTTTTTSAVTSTMVDTATRESGTSGPSSATTETPPTSSLNSSGASQATSTTSTTTTSDASSPATSSTSTTSTTSTTAAPVTKTTTYSLTGGTVTISHSPGVVHLVGASPNSLFETEVKNAGPTEVRVTFENDDHVSEFRAEWEGGELDIKKEEKDDD